MTQRWAEYYVFKPPLVVDDLESYHARCGHIIELLHDHLHWSIERVSAEEARFRALHSQRSEAKRRQEYEETVQQVRDEPGADSDKRMREAMVEYTRNRYRDDSDVVQAFIRALQAVLRVLRPGDPMLPDRPFGPYKGPYMRPYHELDLDKFVSWSTWRLPQDKPNADAAADFDEEYSYIAPLSRPEAISYDEKARVSARSYVRELLPEYD